MENDMLDISSRLNRYIIRAWELNAGIAEICKFLSQKKVEKDLNLITCNLISEQLVHYFNQRRLRRSHGTAKDAWIELISSFCIKDFLNAYSELENDISNSLSDYINQNNSILSDVLVDKKQIEKMIGKNLGRVLQIDVGMGDLHNGRSVALVHFQFSKIIYKPQKYNQYILLSNVLDWLRVRVPNRIKLKFPLVLYRENHSWIEYIENEQLDKAKISDFFYECGLYLAAFYIFGANDMHLENLIVHDNHPVFIDLETLCAIHGEQLEPNLRDISSSVLGTGLIPTSRTKAMDLSLSALFRPENEVSSSIFFDDIQFSEEEGFLYFRNKVETARIEEKAIQNECILYGNESTRKNLKKGFLDGLSEIINDKVNFEGLIRNIFSENDFRFREVLRSTHVYGEILDGMRNPNTRYEKEQWEILRLLDRPCQEQKEISNSEKSSIRKGWIPSYYCFSGNRKLYDSTGTVVDNDFLKKDIPEKVLGLISKLTFSDILYQERLIDLSFIETHLQNIVIGLPNDECSNVLEELECFMKNIEMFRVSDQNNVYYSTQILASKVANIWGVTPGLLNTSGWVLALAYFGGQKHDGRMLSMAKSLNKVLLPQVKKQVFNNYFLKDMSILTGVLGTAFSVAYIDDVLGEDTFNLNDFQIEKDDLSDGELKIFEFLKEGELPTKQVAKLILSETCPISLNKSMRFSMSPKLTGVLDKWARVVMSSKTVKTI